MAYTESDRVQIRQYLGFSSIFLQADPRLESAISATQSTSENGTRPDTSTETFVKTLIVKLQAIDTSLDALSCQVGVVKAEEGIQLDSAREMLRLKGMGRLYVHRLARVFDTFPRSDIYSSAPDLASAYPGYPFSSRNPY